MQKYTIKSLSDTNNLAQKIAEKLKGGEVIALIGNLGAGKTTFVQCLAKNLGVKQTVNSPTFNIIKIYSTSNDNKKISQLVHIDAYRLNSAEELKALGVEEYLDNYETVTVIEWAGKVKNVLPAKVIKIKIDLQKNGNRSFVIQN